MSERPSYIYDEIELAETVGSTGHPAELLNIVFDIPEDLRDKRTLDICTGVSDFPASLRDRGAEAYAYDLIYGYPIDAIVKKVMGQSLENAGIDPAASQAEDEIRRFQGDINHHPSTYIAGSALQLPFKDGSFDVVTSSLGIFGCLDYDLMALKDGFLEAFRVLKPNGQLQIFPVIYDPDPDYELNVRNQQALLKAAKASPVITVEESFITESDFMGRGLGRATFIRSKTK